MGTFRNPHDLARHQKAKAERQAHSLKVGHSKLANECYQEAWRITSGRISTRTLRAMGHPYGRRSGSYSDVTSRRAVLGRQRTVKGSRMRLPGLPINRQSGKLQQAIKLNRRGGTGKVSQSYVLQVLRNIAPYAKYVLSLGGTVKMVTRPFWTHLYKYWKRKNFELLLKTREQMRKG